MPEIGRTGQVVLEVDRRAGDWSQIRGFKLFFLRKEFLKCKPLSQHTAHRHDKGADWRGLARKKSAPAARAPESEDGMVVTVRGREQGGDWRVCLRVVSPCLPRSLSSSVPMFGRRERDGGAASLHTPRCGERGPALECIAEPVLLLDSSDKKKSRPRLRSRRCAPRARGLPSPPIRNNTASQG